ncbi:unnamed protein product, partial [Coregonus sp. 'balchen']
MALFCAGSSIAHQIVFIPGVVIVLGAKVLSSVITGEPYLSAAYAVMMSYWEVVLHFLLFLTMIHCMFRGKSYRSMGLLWAGSSIAQQIVFIPGVVNIVQKCVPPLEEYSLLVVACMGSHPAFSRPRELPIIPADKVATEQKRSLLYHPVDLILFVVLDCPLDTCFTYIYQYEDPVAFPKMLVYLFYALPLLAVFIYGLRTPGCTWMLDWTIFFAGAIAQTQWCHIGGSLHSRTSFTYRVPTDKWLTAMILNRLYVGAPIVLAIQCHISPTFCMPTVPKGETNLEKDN